MKKEDFVSLPWPLAAEQIWDALRDQLERMEAVRPPLPPKFDARLRKNGGFIWVSEMTYEDIAYWHKRNADGANDEKFGESNAKIAATLARWLPWRKLYPDTRWNGTRGDDRVTAEAPSREPKVHKWEDKKGKSGVGRAPASEPPPPPEDDFGF